MPGCLSLFSTSAPVGTKPPQGQGMLGGRVRLGGRPWAQGWWDRARVLWGLCSANSQITQSWAQSHSSALQVFVQEKSSEQEGNTPALPGLTF